MQEVVEFLLNEVNNGLEISDATYGAAFIEAARYKDTSMVEFLLAAGVDVQSRDSRGNTALHIACSDLRLDLAKLLLDSGACPNSHNIHKECPLINVCDTSFEFFENPEEDQIEMVRLLLKYGADVNGHDGVDDSPLYHSTPLIEATRMSHYPIVKLLLQEGADPNDVGLAQRSALMQSASTGHVRIARMLLSHGAQINYRRHRKWDHSWDDSWETALQIAQEASRDPDDDPMVEMLLSNGAVLPINSLPVEQCDIP
ncbi:hypothetical protein N7456_000544 [Penicillium angulare]|uniref:Ankyrin n=1 Tax=Penicillium angulare TaxID=116970 RepID=A0A9W9GCQ2_9EURO|nr:hypothetical protein N7456_000544 [Penicillium angulare]